MKKITKNTAKKLSKAAKTAKGGGKRAPKVEVKATKCLCGCGDLAAPKRLFIQGHDAKLRHKAVATLAGKEKFSFNDEQKAFLKKAGYITVGEAAKL